MIADTARHSKWLIGLSVPPEPLNRVRCRNNKIPAIVDDEGPVDPSASVSGERFRWSSPGWACVIRKERRRFKTCR